MARYKLTCEYCGHIWIENFIFITPYEDDELKCEKCKDRNIKKILFAKSDIFGYNSEEESKKV